MKNFYIESMIRHRDVFLKISLMSKFCVFLLFAGMLTGFANDSYAQKVRISLEMNNAPLSKVITEIKRQTEFEFAYDSDLESITFNKVSVKASNENIEQILNTVLAGTDVNYRIIDRIILLSKNEMVTTRQGIAIRGTVTDENGEPMPGVNVLVKGTIQGVVTDASGKYSINVSNKDAVLVFSFIGYTTQDAIVGDQQVINIEMAEGTQYIDEVVVTALGIRREEKALGYAVQKVSGESLNRVAGVELATSLTGKVAGLLVKNSSDFAVTPDLSIRGENPLIVIDGIAYENKKLSDIPSEDIESMSVLKGATASALYGFRGSSGAILITTKNGSTNKKGLSVDISTNTMFTAGYLAIPEKQSVYGRGSNNAYDKNSTSSWGTAMDGRILEQWDPFLMEYKDYEYLPVGKNNFKNFLEQGYVTNNNVSATYRGEVASLRSSFNWTENKGRYPNQKLDKFSYAMGGDINTGNFQLTSNLSYSKRMSPNMGSNGYTSYDPMYSLLIWSSADFDIRDYKDNYWFKKDEIQNYTYKNESNNPYFDMYEKINEVSRDIFNADLSANYSIFEWMKATIRSGIDFYIDRADQRVSWGSYNSTGNTPIPGNPYTWNGAWTGAYNTGQTQGFSINNDLLLSGEKSFNKFNVEYVAGGTIYYKKDNTIFANTVGGISVPGFFSLKASVEPANVGQTTYGRQVNSLYGRLGLSWNRMIYIEATGRNDWSSTLPSSTRSYFYPSVAGSFVISELLPSASNWLDLLKVRSSWTMSKTPPGIYDVNSVFSITSGTWMTLNGATAPSSIYPDGVLPESSNTFEVGMQGMFLKNRIMVDLSYYNKRMYDFLTNAPLSSASGYTGILVNTDEEITRRGWELTINGTPIKKQNWQWDIGFNWSTYARYYTKLDETYSSTKPWVKVGNRVDALVSKDLMYAPSGIVIYNNGRLQYSQYDSNFGWTDPDWVWGVNSTLRYKNFTLFVSLDGVVGGLMNTRTESYMWQAGIHPKSITDARAKDVATPGSQNFVGKGVKVASGDVTFDQNGFITSDTRTFAANDVASTYSQYAIDLHNSSAWGGNGSPADTYSKTFLKFRELSLTYQVPAKYLEGFWAKSASIGFIGQNVLLWAKDFKYSDPDGGVEDFADPSVRYLGFNIKLSF